MQMEFKVKIHRALYTVHTQRAALVILLILLIGVAPLLFTHHNYPPHFEEVGENSFGVGFA